MDLVTSALLLLVITVAWFVYCLYKPMGAPKPLPPGPEGLPYLGCVNLMLSELHRELTKMADTWGDMFSFKIMGEKVVVLGSPETLRDAFTRKVDWEIFAGRPQFYISSENLLNGIIFSQPTTEWNKLRKLSHKILHHYGEGLGGSEELIHEELRHLVSVLEKRSDSFNLMELLHSSFANIMTSLLKGDRMDYDDETLHNVVRMDELINNSFSLGTTTLLQLFPFLKYIPVGLGKQCIENKARTKKFLEDYFEQPKATFDPEVTRGMMDFMFRQQIECTQKDDCVWLEDKYIKAVCQDMVLAGSNTTSRAVYAFFLILLNHDRVKKRLQDEIDRVVGSDRQPTLHDRGNMPYTLATINELLRYTSHVPLISLRTTRDVHFRGFFIPNNTTILGNTWRVHHDPAIYPEPWLFQPERFLDSGGNLLPTEHPVRKNLTPFGFGRRMCIGETFARSRIFLYITTLLQKFDFLSDCKPPPSCDPRNYKHKVVLTPEPYQMSFILR